MRAAKPAIKSVINYGFSLFYHIGILGLAVMYPAAAVFGQSASPQESAKSVVKITCKMSGEVSAATGFVWSKSTYVVTALHAVAGCDKITVYSESEKDETGAQVVAVYKEADLALLKLDRDLKLKPLGVTAAAAGINEEHSIWGYPRDVATMQGDDIKFSKSLTANPTLKNIFKSPAQFKKIVGTQGYPQLDAQILRVGSIIQPGHSGAPIFNDKGFVVGIADGGLREGIARINWAIPASVYLPNLPDSKDAIPHRPSVQNTLFSTHVEDRQVNFDAHKGETADAGEQPAAENVLHLVGSASVSDIISTKPDEDLQDYYRQIDSVKQETGQDLGQAMIDIYEDYQTGATVAVPHDINLEYDAEYRTLEAWTDNDKIEMIVQIIDNDTWDEGMETMKDFDAYLVGDENWQPDPEQQDEQEYDKTENFWYLDKSRVLKDENGEITGQMLATLIIDQNDFLGAGVIIHDLSDLTDKEIVMLHTMLICAELANFAID